MSLIKKFNIIFLIIFGLIITGCSGQSIQKMEEQKGSLYDLNSLDVSNLKLITIDGTTLDLENIEGEFVRNQYLYRQRKKLHQSQLNWDQKMFHLIPSDID